MFVRTLLSVLSLSALVACGGSPAMDPQLPPTTGRTDVEAWLTAGFYKSWSCEPTSHAKRSPSPHDQNRICSNAALSGFAGTGEYPVGAAGVKELFDDTGKTIVGYAVAVAHQGREHRRHLVLVRAGAADQRGTARWQRSSCGREWRQRTGADDLRWLSSSRRVRCRALGP